MSYFREAINFMEEYIPGEQPEKEVHKTQYQRKSLSSFTSREKKLKKLSAWARFLSILIL